MQSKGEFFDLNNIEVQCWAFAPPPVFGPLDKLHPDHKKDI